MKISLRCEDAEGGSWNEDAVIHGRNEDELVDSAIEAAQNCFQPAWDAKGKRVPGPVTVSCYVGSRSVEVRDETEINVY